ncbi:hypothetical protein [Shinella sp.]|uniref:hypothetical protein n=1 Tax=Shinella sp. TaxID=1870904 RepID=UPI0039E556EF
MKQYLFATALMIVSGISLTGPASAQCLECSQQMMEGTLSGNAWYNIDQDQIDQTRKRDADNGVYYDANRHLKPREAESDSGDIVDRTQNASFSVLNSEYKRRVSAYGKDLAGQWLIDASRNVGGEVGALRTEYLRRVQSEGRSRADRWYMTQARRISERYVANNSR